MNVIIAGGTGLIGRALAEELHGAGHQVMVLTRRLGAEQGLPPWITPVQWDGKSAEGWGRWVDEVDAVVNLAGENIAGTGLLPRRWTAEVKQRIRQSRLTAGNAITQAIVQASRKPAVLIQASASGYYGPRGDELIDESAPAGSDFLASVARAWEPSTAEVEALGVRRVIIRSGVVLSARGGALPRLLLPIRLGLGGRLGSGRQWIPWVHIEDEVRAIRFLMENSSARGPYNVSAPEPVTNAELVRTLARVLRRPAVLPIPAFALRLLFGELASTLLEGQRMIPKRLLEEGFTFRFPMLEPAVRDILTRGL
ncbi:MAG: TIGR01777 family oxidoreductase [Anaerolineae bacterium]